MVSRQDQDSRFDNGTGKKSIRLAEQAFSHPCYLSSSPQMRIYPVSEENERRSRIPKQGGLSEGAGGDPAREKGFLPAFVLPHFASQVPRKNPDSSQKQEKDG